MARRGSMIVCIILSCVLLLSLHGTTTSGRKEISPVCQFKEKGVKFFDAKISHTSIPANLTTYVCQIKSIPLSPHQDYHAIGFLPLVSNTDAVHHMILFGCPQSLAHGYQRIHYCGSSDNGCRQFLVQWTRGMPGSICSHPNAGVRFGRVDSSIRSLSLQIHWNNQHRREGLSDASGFRIFYTAQPREFDLGNVQIGQNNLEIPAGHAHFPQTGSCSSECTKEWLPHPIYLTRAHIHMHHTGDGGSIYIKRRGTSEMVEVVDDPRYDYDQPPAHTFHTPIQVLPGDEIQVTCFFNTRDGLRERKTTLHWGKGSDGEMCYAFVSYYPRVPDFDQCIQFDQYDICTADGFAPLGECIFPGFIHVFQGMANEILHQCTTTTPFFGITKLCSPLCRFAIQEVSDHPCMQDRLGAEARRVYLPEVSVWPRIKSIMEESERICTVLD